MERMERLVHLPFRHSADIASERDHRTRPHRRIAHPFPVAIEDSSERTVVARADINQAEVTFVRGLVYCELAVNAAPLEIERHRLCYRRKHRAHREQLRLVRIALVYFGGHVRAPGQAVIEKAELVEPGQRQKRIRLSLGDVKIGGPHSGRTRPHSAWTLAEDRADVG